MNLNILIIIILITLIYFYTRKYKTKKKSNFVDKELSIDEIYENYKSTVLKKTEEIKNNLTSLLSVYS